MKKEYSSPEFEMTKVRFIKDVLTISDPDQGVTTGGGSGQPDPGEDPFGEGDW